VIAVRAICLDIDPVRTNGDKKAAATDAEVAAAEKVAREIAASFEARDHPPPVLAMSGNGWQLWIAIPEILLAPENRERVAANLHAFQRLVIDRLSTPAVRIDNIGDLPRIIKVIGTLSVKGTPTAERPHRLSYAAGPFERREDARLAENLLTLEPPAAGPPPEAAVAPIEPAAAPDPEWAGLVESDPELRQLWYHGWPKDPKDRSMADFHFARRLLELDVPDDQIAALLVRRPNTKAATHSWGPARYASYTIRNAKRKMARSRPPLPVVIPPPDPTIDLAALIRNAIREGGLLQVYGATRSGKTTTTLLVGWREGRRMVLVVPRVGIIEDTVREAAKIAVAEGLTPYIVALPDVRQSCLKLKEQITFLRSQQKNPDEPVAMELLNRWKKPSCHDCKYLAAVPEKLVPGELYGYADEERKICGYQTLIQKADQWNLVALSGSKLVALHAGQDIKFVRPKALDIVTTGDLFVLDEMSSFLETPALDVTVWVMGDDPDEVGYRLLDELRREIAAFRTYIAKHRGDDTESFFYARAGILTDDYYARFEADINHGTATILDGGEAFLYKRSMTSEEREALFAASDTIHKALMGEAVNDNLAHNTVLDMLSLLPEYEWIFTNVPEPGSVANIHVLIAPKVAVYAGALRPDAPIVALDAVASIIPIEQILLRERKVSSNVGDPRHTNEGFAIAPDSRRVRAGWVYADETIRRLDNTVEWAVRFFGADTIGILSPSIEVDRTLRRRYKERWPDLDFLYHRGTRTIGVSYDRRVGISVCAPLAPPRSQDWKRLVYPDTYGTVTSNQLVGYEQGIQTQQGEGRFKDPTGSVRSVVMAWGQPRSLVEASYSTSCAPPRILPPPPGS